MKRTAFLLFFISAMLSTGLFLSAVLGIMSPDSSLLFVTGMTVLGSAAAVLSKYCLDIMRQM